MNRLARETGKFKVYWPQASPFKVSIHWVRDDQYIITPEGRAYVQLENIIGLFAVGVDVFFDEKTATEQLGRDITGKLPTVKIKRSPRPGFIQVIAPRG